MTTLKLEDVLAAMRSVERQPFDTLLAPPGIFGLDRASGPDSTVIWERGKNDFHGMRVVESPHAKVRARVHKRRRGMSAAYHRRVQKKWDKRYGYQPAAFLLNTDVLRESLRVNLPEWPALRLKDITDNSILNMALAAG